MPWLVWQSLCAVGRDYLACSAARGSGTCSNRQSIRRAALEALILDGLRQRLMAPELVEEFVRAFQQEQPRRSEIEQSLAAAPASTVRLHPNWRRSKGDRSSSCNRPSITPRF